MTILHHISKPPKLYGVVFAITALWLITLTIMFATQIRQLSVYEQLSAEKDVDPLIESVQSRQNDFSDQLQVIGLSFQDAQTITAAGLQTLSQSVDERFTELQNKIMVNEADLSDIIERMVKLDERIGRLIKAASETPALKRPAQPTRNAIKQDPPSLPFILLGVELRGSERLLSVTPKSNPSLNNARLLRQGEFIDGWQLQEFNGNEATFFKDGQQRKLTLP